MSALPSTTVHAIPAPLEVIPKAMVELGADLLHRAATVAITDATTLQYANGAVTELHRLEKDEAEQYKKVKGPVTQLGKAIDQIHNGFAGPLVKAKDALKDKIAAYERKVEAERQEIIRKAAEAKRLAEEAAEKERQRLQAIADAEHAAKVAALKAKAEAEAKELADLLGTPIEERPVVEPAKVVVEAPKPVLPTTATLMPAHAEPSVLTTRKVQKVRILSAKRVAAVFEIGLHRFVTINEREVEAALKAGASVDGAELYWEETTVMKGNR